jgi:hypothetical protein
MPRIADVLERESRTVDLEQGDFKRLLGRRERKQRNRRISAGVLGVAVFALAAIGFARLLGSEGTPASPPSSPFEGTWVSTSDADGGTQTMIVHGPADDAVEITVLDDVATVCGGAPSTMTGTGRIEGGTALVISAPVYACDDGSEPETAGGQPLEEQLRDWTLVLDPQHDRLSDGFGNLWKRAGADGGVPLADLEPVWPQTSLEEVRQAQELADAGDPRYTWQVDRNLSTIRQLGQHHPSDAQIFGRFLKEKLGWEDFRWDEAAAHPDGLDPGDVVYIRCAPGGTNPLYPDDPEAGCAPTLDDYRYETVAINVAQLDRQGPAGIWVVTGWEEIEPFEQVAPPSDAEIAALLEPFLQARIDGEGAQGFAEFAEYDEFADVRVDREIPLLYATSTGAPYERSEFGIVDGPVWPEGQMQVVVRVFAQNDQIVVEQAFSLERDETGRLRLVYDFEPSGPDGRPILATTENGKAVPVGYRFLDGEVTYRATSPAAPRVGTIWEQGPDVATIVGTRQRRLLLILAEPRPIGPDCEEAPAPADAEALARSIRSDSDFEADAPVPVTIGGIPALQMDVVLSQSAVACPWQLPNMSSTTPLLLKGAPVDVQADRARLYLLDLPGGSARVLAIAIMSDADSFEHALKVAAPIVNSIEFHDR